jgi:tetratricopeptide (TPR) repeat protein
VSHLLERARELLRLRRPAEARAEVGAHLSEAPHDPEGHCLMALVLLQQGERAAALERAEHAVSLAPKSVQAHVVLGFVHLAHGKSKLAVEAAEEALAIDPDDVRGHVLQSRAQLGAGRPWHAMRAARAALALAPDDDDHHLLHALSLQAAGDVAGALSATQRGLALAPDDAELHTVRGELLLADGRAEAAVGAFRTALRNDAQSESARAGLLEALRARHPAYRPALALRLGAVQLLRRRGGWRIVAICYVACLAIALLAGGFGSLRSVRPTLIGTVVAVLLVPVEVGNTLLLAHPFGRQALQRREKFFALLTTALLLLTIVVAAVGAATGRSSLRQPTIQLAVSTLFAAALHFAIDHSTIRRQTWILLAIMAAIAAALVLT